MEVLNSHVAPPKLAYNEMNVVYTFSLAFLYREGFHATGIAINHLLPMASEREAADTSYSIESIQIGAIFRRSQNGFFAPIFFAIRVQSAGAIFAYRHYWTSDVCLSVWSNACLIADWRWADFFALGCLINDSSILGVLLLVVCENFTW